VLVVYATFAMHLKLGLLLIKGKRDGDKLVLVVSITIVAKHDNARITDLHLGPRTLSKGVNAE
jgi:hypothetical protein